MLTGAYFINPASHRRRRHYKSRTNLTAVFYVCVFYYMYCLCSSTATTLQYNCYLFTSIFVDASMIFVKQRKRDKFSKYTSWLCCNLYVPTAWGSSSIMVKFHLSIPNREQILRQTGPPCSTNNSIGNTWSQLWMQ